jgi:hypothetical protein
MKMMPGSKGLIRFIQMRMGDKEEGERLYLWV